MKKIILCLSFICIFYCMFYTNYSINIENDNAFLKELRINYEGIVPKFEKDIYKYYLTVSENTNELEVLAIGENENSEIEIIGNTNFQNGLNTITITVVSEDKKQSKIYTIEVTKTSNIEFANSNLEILAIENALLNPPFDANITNYEAEVSNEMDIINILAIPQNEKAKVEIEEIEKLQVGNNLININITAQNGFSKKVYTINVYKRKKEENIQLNENENYNIEKTGFEIKKNKRYNFLRLFFIGFIILTVGIVLLKNKQ